MQEKSTQFPNPHLFVDLAVLGGGPAGLRAAEVALKAGVSVALFDQKPSPGRKFLLAGKGGLNISNALPIEKFLTHYKGGSPNLWASLLADFSFEDLRNWTAELGVETFIGTSDRLFPTGKYAAPLLRRWLQKLRASGLQLFTRHKWLDMKQKDGKWQTLFEMNGETAVTATGAPVVCESKAVLFAMGGASYPETGSDGAWQQVFRSHHIPCQTLAAANCGWEVSWPAPLPPTVEGQPIKNITAHAGDASLSKPGELLLTAYGLEGGLIYHFGAALRSTEHPVLWLNLKPTYTSPQLCDLWRGDKSGHDTLLSLDSPEGRAIFRKLEKAWKLSSAHSAVLRSIALGIFCPPASRISTLGPASRHETTPISVMRQLLPCTLGPHCTIRALSILIGQLPILLSRPRPVDEAISSAGGVSWNALNSSLMLRDFPGLFCAGEMLDWEAPTGGYLLHGALATGTRAGKGAAAYITP
ncbi:MAG: NAD(P)/FAD-dependent oxidoreductase [Candidatus Methylacidiphilales bacterium]|nr:NAD(P)/FAD-dependent oxidoreductase [Candidatus Methylacidiphilales bacterium]